MEKLERLNKETESVKTKVEDNQKKLSKYVFEPQSTIASFLWKESHHRKDTSKKEGCLKGFENEAVRSKDFQLESRKYVIDHRCPTSHLEYDPLLNYSASLLNTTKVEQETIEKDLLLNFTKPVLENWNDSSKRGSSRSPIKLEINLQESDEDDLVIDAPPLLPIFKKSRMMKRFKTWNMEENIPLEEGNLTGSDMGLTSLIREETKLDEVKITMETNDNKYTKQFKKASETSTITQNADLQCVSHSSKGGNLINEGEKYTFISKENTEKQAQIKRCRTDHQKDGNVLKKNYKVDEKQVECQYLRNPPQITYSEGFPKSKIMPIKDTCQKTNEGNIEYTPGKASHKELENASFSIPSCLSKPSHLIDQFYGKQDAWNSYNLLSSYDNNKKIGCTLEESEVIVINSSDEEIPQSSDSDDPMEECLKIFNEFTENTSQKGDNTKQSLGKLMHSDTVDSKTILTPGPKKRIAHTAKFDVPVNKETIHSFQDPIPPLASHPRILQVQQQAVQITAAIKGGQAYVAALSEQKKHATGDGSSQLLRTSSQNFLETSPVMANSTHLNAVLSGDTFIRTPRKPTVHTKNIAPLSVKLTKNNTLKRKWTPMISKSMAKVPHEMRQKYVSFFFEEYMKICKTTDEAFDKALIEEKAIYKHCSSKNTYLNIAVNALRKLRDPDLCAVSSVTEYAKQEEKNALSGIALYRHLKEYLLTEEQLDENNYPQSIPGKPGSAVLKNTITKGVLKDALRRICCRCGKIYTVTSVGKHIRIEECNYHYGTVLKHKVPGGLETRYSCCEGVVGSSGCQTAKLHVHDDQKENLEGFVKTFSKLSPPDGYPGVFAVDCEVCYTTKGLELVRVAVVNPDLQVVYDTFVKPENEIIDYNSRFSGVTEDDLKNTKASLRDVQAILLNLFNADTILIGHSLERDLLALKLIHNTVIDTSILFPHRLGLPHKRALRNLIADYLRQIIQDNVGGHNSIEDATACMELILWKVKDDAKGRK